MVWLIGVERYPERALRIEIFTECVEIYKKISFLIENKEATIVECGCGRGGLLSCLRDGGYTNIVGYDITPGRVEVCVKAGLNVLIHDISSIPLEDNSVDCIIYEEVLEYLEEEKFRSSLKEADRVLVKDGYLLIASVAFEPFRLAEGSNYERVMRECEIVDLLPGFEIIERSYLTRGKKYMPLLLVFKKEFEPFKPTL